VCKPGDSTEDIDLEAREMGEGVAGLASAGSSKKQLIGASVLALASIAVGLFAAPFFYNVRGVAALEAKVEVLSRQIDEVLRHEESESQQLQDLQAQVVANTNKLAIGERYTLEQELAYREVHHAKEAERHTAIRERLAVLEYKNEIQ